MLSTVIFVFPFFFYISVKELYLSIKFKYRIYILIETLRTYLTNIFDYFFLSLLQVRILLYYMISTWNECVWFVIDFISNVIMYHYVTKLTMIMMLWLRCAINIDSIDSFEAYVIAINTLTAMQQCLTFRYISYRIKCKRLRSLKQQMSIYRDLSFILLLARATI